MRQWSSCLWMAIAFVTSTQVSRAQQPAIAWQNDIAAAQQQAAQTNKYVLLHFWSPDCDHVSVPILPGVALWHVAYRRGGPSPLITHFTRLLQGGFSG